MIEFLMVLLLLDIVATLVKSNNKQGERGPQGPPGPKGDAGETRVIFIEKNTENGGK